MSGVIEGRMDASDDGGRKARSSAPDGRPEGGREVRWSARRKQEVVLRLLRGESLEALARETGPAAGLPRNFLVVAELQGSRGLSVLMGRRAMGRSGRLPRSSLEADRRWRGAARRELAFARRPARWRSAGPSLPAGGSSARAVRPETGSRVLAGRRRGACSEVLDIRSGSVSRVRGVEAAQGIAGEVREEIAHGRHATPRWDGARRAPRTPLACQRCAFKPSGG
jgi:hypothetical protein